MVGARVVSTQSGAGGYSPSFASRCDLDDGRRVFVKAVSPAQNPQSPDMLRSEIDVTQRLPASVPGAAAVARRYDDGDWVVGVFEYVDGRAARATRGTTGEAATVSRAVDGARRRYRSPSRCAGCPPQRIVWRRRSAVGRRCANESAAASARRLVSARISTISWRSNRDGATQCAATRSSISTSAATTSSSSRPVASCSSTGRTRASAHPGWTSS